MGEVLLAEREDALGQRTRVVLKRLLDDLDDDDGRYLRMLLAEADVMSRLRHPNIVRVFDTPIIDRTQCLAMEWVHGKNLHALLRRCRGLDGRRRGLPPRLALYVVDQVLKGLAYAHAFVLDDGRSLELVHRDITPGNILVSYDGDVKLTDFGIAKSRISRNTTTVGVVKGTTRYLSPEQVRCAEVTARSDLFAAGLVLVELLTGRPVFEHDTVPATLFAIVSSQREDLRRQVPGLPESFVCAIDWALAKEPWDRPSSADELRLALAEGAFALGPPASRAELSDHLRQLFPEDEAPLSAFEVSDTNDLRPADPVDVACLLELVDPIAAAPPPVRAELDAMVAGGRPLDAEHFGASSPALSARAMGAVRDLPGQVAKLPGQVVLLNGRLAEARAKSRAMGFLQFAIGVVFGLGLTYLIGRVTAPEPLPPRSEPVEVRSDAEAARPGAGAAVQATSPVPEDRAHEAPRGRPGGRR
jgi:tRNA A-37 threonylcarbamoyl transferase component Bud32